MSLAVLWTVLPWLAVLACPLTMLLMMRSMGGGGCHEAQQRARGAAGDEPAGRNVADEVAALKLRLVELEAAARESSPHAPTASSRTETVPSDR